MNASASGKNKRKRASDDEGDELDDRPRRSRHQPRLSPPLLLLSDQDCHLVDFPHGPPVTRGGFCEIYKAVYRPKNITLAMKTLLSDFPDDDALRRFRREAEVWSTFKHINILPFFGTLKINGRLYLASPWMSLGDLLTFVQTRVGFIQQDKGILDASAPPIYSRFCETRIVREIATGLEYLHAIDVVHGDVKANNVLLTEGGCAQLCDFGLTKTPDHSATSTGLRGAGSARWLSPEVLEDGPKSAESDVYAFGITISEILTCNHPFPHLKTLPAVILAIMTRNERPGCEPSSRLGADFGSLWNLAARCWTLKPEDRPLIPQVLEQLKRMQPRTNEAPRPVFQRVPKSPQRLGVSYWRRVESCSPPMGRDVSSLEAEGSRLNPFPRYTSDDDLPVAISGTSRAEMNNISLSADPPEKRIFYNKIVGKVGVAWVGHCWSLRLTVFTAWGGIQASEFSSPYLPPWLRWNENVLSGVPDLDAPATEITVAAKLILHGVEAIVQTTFSLRVATPAVDCTAFDRHIASEQVPIPAPARSEAWDDFRHFTIELFVSSTQPSSRPFTSDTQATLTEKGQAAQILVVAARRGNEYWNQPKVVPGLRPTPLMRQRQVLITAAQAIAHETEMDLMEAQEVAISSKLSAIAMRIVDTAWKVQVDKLGGPQQARGPQISRAPPPSISLSAVSAILESAVVHAVWTNVAGSTDLEIMMAADTWIQHTLKPTSHPPDPLLRTPSSEATPTSPIILP